MFVLISLRVAKRFDLMMDCVNLAKRATSSLAINVLKINTKAKYVISMQPILLVYTANTDI